MPKPRYDLIVLGSGPAGEKAAVKAAYFGKRVALVEKEQLLGGAGVNTGTLPSKTLKETALFFSGKYDKGFYGVNRELSKNASIEDFLFRSRRVSSAVEVEVRENLDRHGVVLYQGAASFEDPHTIQVSQVTSAHREGVNLKSSEIFLEGEFILIATGSYPFHPLGIPFDGKRVHDSDSILRLTSFPRSICIVGAGVIGCEYATIFATMGVQVHLIHDLAGILGFLDDEIARSLTTQMARDGINLVLGAELARIQMPSEPMGNLKVELKSGKTIECDMFLFASGRSGNTSSLRCERAGVLIGKRETISVNEKYQTSVAHIYAAGDVIGFPALASTSMDQGRIAVSHMFQTHDLDRLTKLYPYGIYTIPEVSMVGLTEAGAKAAGINYATGKASHARMPRGRIMGATEGYLKIVFARDDLTIKGVHIIGHLASELIHYGMALIEGHRKITDVIETVFNYPTLHDLYKYACYDGLGNLSGHKVKPDD